MLRLMIDIDEKKK